MGHNGSGDESVRVEMDHSCTFCMYDRSKAIVENQFGFSILDAHPVSNGHCLIIPEEHQWDYFKLSKETRKGLDALLIAVKEHLDDSYSPDGYNIGINNGRAAGQTIMHAHIHVIPRYMGDTNDPRGGIRWIFPRRASFWES